jgi:hypothetical protein
VNWPALALPKSGAAGRGDVPHHRRAGRERRRWPLPLAAGMRLQADVLLERAASSNGCSSRCSGCSPPVTACESALSWAARHARAA